MKNATIVLMILGAALTRLIPHAPNVTAVTALALLGGAYISHRSLAVLIPVIALWISDLFLGFHSTMLVVYAATSVIALAATYGLKNSTGVLRLAAGSISASVFFFLVTNFAVWKMDTLYPKTWMGFQECYAMALPFLGNQMLGDLFYTGVLFGAAALVRSFKPELFAKAV